MKLVFRSIVTAFAISAAVLSCAVFVLAPRLPCVVGRPTVEEKRTLTFPAARQVRLTNPDGAVWVRTDRPDIITVVVDIKAYTSGKRSRAIAEEYAKSLVAITRDEALLNIVTEPQERPDAVDLVVDYSLQVPEGTNVALESANGNVLVSEGCGDVTVQGRNTDIEIVEPRGKVTATSTNGRIRIVDALSETSAQTINGSVYAHMQGGDLEATTTNGAIVARVLSRQVKSCDLTSQNGGITLVMDAGSSARVNARTARGRIRVDLPLNTQQGCKNRRHVRGTIGDGQTNLTVNALNGNIWIARSD